MARSCQRNTCHRAAVAALTFRYDTAEVRLSDLQRDFHPQRWELCPAHAAGLTVPRGWAFVDDRSPEPVAAAELAHSGQAMPAAPAPLGEPRPARPARAGTPGQSGAGCSGGSRYAALQADLPRLAAELARRRQLEFADEAEAQAPPIDRGGSPRAADPPPTRELGGMPGGDVPRAPRRW